MSDLRAQGGRPGPKPYPHFSVLISLSFLAAFHTVDCHLFLETGPLAHSPHSLPHFSTHLFSTLSLNVGIMQGSVLGTLCPW